MREIAIYGIAALFFGFMIWVLIYAVISPMTLAYCAMKNKKLPKIVNRILIKTHNVELFFVYGLIFAYLPVFIKNIKSNK